MSQILKWLRSYYYLFYFNGNEGNGTIPKNPILFDFILFNNVTIQKKIHFIFIEFNNVTIPKNPKSLRSQNVSCFILF